MRPGLTPIVVPHAETLEDLRRTVEVNLNRLISQLNRAGSAHPTDAAGERLRNIDDPAAGTDAVNLRTLLKQTSQFADINSALRKITADTSISLAADANTHKTAAASAQLTLSTTVTDITGATVTLDKNGTWVVVGIFEFIHSGTDGTQRGYLDYNGATQTGNSSHLGSATAEKATVAQVWFLTVTGQPKVAKLRADKSSGASSSTCEATNTTINAVFLKA